MIPVQVAKLSRAQKIKLAKNQTFRIKEGSGDEVMLTEAQLQKFLKNTRLSKAYTLKFSKDQVAVQGSGILADIAGFINPTAGMLAKVVGLGVKPRCVRGRCETKRGKGILGDLLSFGGKTLANFAIDKGVDYAKSKIIQLVLD